MSLSRDTLFILRAPFEDRELEGAWFCTSCATMEGALLANPHWANRIDVKRSEHPRPRREIINLIGEENQSMPVLVLWRPNASAASISPGRSTARPGMKRPPRRASSPASTRRARRLEQGRSRSRALKAISA